MPKEAPCLSEHNPSVSSSKNAKNKSNSLTLMAMRETKDVDDSSGTGSRCSSEKDSGYSDGSDWQQTDVEDQRSNQSQSKGSEQAATSQTGQTKDLQQGNPGNPTLKTAGRELQPIYIINNMVLKKFSHLTEAPSPRCQFKQRPPRHEQDGGEGEDPAQHVGPVINTQISLTCKTSVIPWT